MNEQKYPQFERLHILRAEALCSLRERAFDVFPLYLRDCSDGIVSGCDFVTTKNLVTLQPGLILHENFLYFIQEPMSVEYWPTEEYALLKLIFEPPTLTENFLQRNVRINLSAEMQLAPNEMELCRFKLKRGAILRTKYTDFFDMATEFDTVNLINAPHAAVGGATLAPEILRTFASEAKNFELDSEDFSFCLAALSGKILNVDQIAFYVERRLKIELTARDNQTLYENLCKILSDIKNGNRRELLSPRRRRREIMVE
ncbi:MAG: hypothetical protein IJ685_04195 [Selenomonadaceae bacterium]|nr:hypothetical protein [Selenomonadaceae bacterium]